MARRPEFGAACHWSARPTPERAVSSDADDAVVQRANRVAKPGAAGEISHRPPWARAAAIPRVLRGVDRKMGNVNKVILVGNLGAAPAAQAGRGRSPGLLPPAAWPRRPGLQGQRRASARSGPTGTGSRCGRKPRSTAPGSSIGRRSVYVEGRLAKPPVAGSRGPQTQRDGRGRDPGWSSCPARTARRRCGAAGKTGQRRRRRRWTAPGRHRGEGGRGGRPPAAGARGRVKSNHGAGPRRRAAGVARRRASARRDPSTRQPRRPRHWRPGPSPAPDSRDKTLVPRRRAADADLADGRTPDTGHWARVSVEQRAKLGRPQPAQRPGRMARPDRWAIWRARIIRRAAVDAGDDHHHVGTLDHRAQAARAAADAPGDTGRRAGGRLIRPPRPDAARSRSTPPTMPTRMLRPLLPAETEGRLVDTDKRKALREPSFERRGAGGVSGRTRTTLW